MNHPHRNAGPGGRAGLEPAGVDRMGMKNVVALFFQQRLKPPVRMV